MASNSQTIKDSRYGRDLVLRETARGEGGSLPTAAGKSNLEQALRHQILDDRGTLTHRPDYGSSLTNMLGEANSPAGRARLANSLYRSLSKDPRFASVQVQVSLGSNSSTVLVEVSVVPLGESQNQAVAFTVPVGI